MPEHHPESDRRGLGGERTQYASPFTLVGRLRSFRNAAKGVWFVLRSQHNAWVHAAATVAVLGLGTFLHVTVRPFTLGQWSALVIAIVMVWVAETFNTGLEVLAEAITQERHPVLKVAKDIAAAAVLIAAVGAAIVGAILFIPPILELVKRCG
jgi:diacylglycerol kinase (ATP)